MFWGSKWAKANQLSGGGAPNSFKGFAESTTPDPAVCGGTWRTDPGNSPPPPDMIPSVINVIAASSITKSGSELTGNIRKIVTVQVDSGYDSDPGHNGTGTVIAINCASATIQQMEKTPRRLSIPKRILPGR